MTEIFELKEYVPYKIPMKEDCEGWMAQLKESYEEMTKAKDYSEVTPVERKPEMCIPKISLEDEEGSGFSETELAYLLSEEVMSDIYQEEVYRQLEKDIQEEESLVVIDRFVREMCDYYKVAQADYVIWQHYYNYMIEETVQVAAAKGREPPKGYITTVQKQFNEEMKKHVEETRLEDEAHAADDGCKYIGDLTPLWEALEKHK